MVRLGPRRALAVRRAGMGAAALGFALVPVVIVGGPAQAFAPSPTDYRQYELTVLPDVNAGNDSGTTAALLDTERNSTGAAAGTPHAAVVPEADASSMRWKGVGGAASSLFSAIAMMPLIFSIGDAASNGYFSKAAKQDCAVADQGVFGALSAWAANVAGFSCQNSGATKDPAYSPQYKGSTGPTGFPVTVTAPTYANQYGGTVTWGTPYWSSATFTSRNNPTVTLTEGWVYPINYSGSWYSASGSAPAAAFKFFIRGADGNADPAFNSGQIQQTNIAVPSSRPAAGCAGYMACISLTRLADYQNSGFALTVDDVGVTGVSADTPGGVTWAPATAIQYYPVGNGASDPTLNAGGSAAPVKLRTTLTDDQGHTATCDSAQFLETDTVIPRPCEPVLPSGWGVTQHRTVEIVPVTGTTAPSVIQDYNTSPGYREQHSTYPQCTNTLCLLTLTKIAGSTQGECSDFSVQPNPCADWASDPNESTDYRCDYGGTQVALAECEKAYKRMYKPGAITSGSVYVDPAGDPIPSDPATPTTVPTPTTPPTTSTTPSECFPTGWGVLNPVEWVLKPVECALVWAFVPPADTLTGLQARFSGDIANTPLGQVDGLVNGLTGPFMGIGASGCQGPPLRFNAFGVDQTFYPMDACSEPVAGAASFVSGALGFTVIALSVLSITRYIAGTVGFVGFATTRMRDSTAGEGGKS